MRKTKKFLIALLFGLALIFTSCSKGGVSELESFAKKLEAMEYNYANSYFLAETDNTNLEVRIIREISTSGNMKNYNGIRIYVRESDKQDDQVVNFLTFTVPLSLTSLYKFDVTRSYCSGVSDFDPDYKKYEHDYLYSKQGSGDSTKAYFDRTKILDENYDTFTLRWDKGSFERTNTELMKVARDLLLKLDQYIFDGKEHTYYCAKILGSDNVEAVGKIKFKTTLESLGITKNNN